MPRRPRTPSYRLHKRSGQAVVTLDGRDHYLGRFDSEESRAEYRRVTAEWLASGGRPAGPDLSVNELILAYLRWAEGYYVKNGRVTTEANNVKQSLRHLRYLYGHTPARSLGPLALKAVRQAMIASGWCRSLINQRVGRIIRMFKWAASEERLPVTVYEALRTVAGLRRGRSEARETEPIKPVSEAFIDAIEPHVSRQVWAMVRLQALSGMRPSEVCAMRTIDIDTSGKIWIYRPVESKMEHYGRRREVYLGPRAQKILKPWLRPDLSAYLFSPREATAQRRAEQRRNRKSPVQPSQRDRSKARPKRTPAERYSVTSYRHAVQRGCDRAGVPRWGPNRLRHSAATRLRREFGLDVARACLGHSSPVVTEIYAEMDACKAIEAMERLG